MKEKIEECNYSKRTVIDMQYVSLAIENKIDDLLITKEEIYEDKTAVMTIKIRYDLGAFDKGKIHIDNILKRKPIIAR